MITCEKVTHKMCDKGLDQAKIIKVYRSVPSQLAKGNKNFQFMLLQQEIFRLLQKFYRVISKITVHAHLTCREVPESQRAPVHKFRFISSSSFNAFSKILLKQLYTLFLKISPF